MAPKRIEKTAGCCASFWAELSPFQPWFLAHDSSGYKIDIPEAFAPSGPMTIIGKLITTGIALATLFVGLLSTPNVSFFFAYWTNVSLVLTIFYLLFSFLNTTFPGHIQQPMESVRGRARWAWILFVAGVHGQFMASLLWWLTVYDPVETELKFYSVSAHGLVCFLALIDGLVLNRIPLRLFHWWGFIFPVQVLYLIWTIVHWQLNVGNPNEQDEDPTTNDDAIYSVLAWDGDAWVSSAIVSVLVVFAGGPLVYFYMWCLARFPYGCCTSGTRLYYLGADNRSAASKRRAAQHDVEAGSRYSRLFGSGKRGEV